MSTITDIGTLITQTPGVCGGRPVIDGTRIPVSSIVQNHRRGLAVDELYSQPGLCGAFCDTIERTLKPAVAPALAPARLVRESVEASS